jgi:hypothetical protein
MPTRNIKEAVRAAHERATFCSFVEWQGARSSWADICSRPEPEPDLLCEHVREGLVAFELVRVVSGDLAAVLAGSGRMGMAAFSTSDPTTKIIRDKLHKRYVTEHPIELLIYREDLVITTDAGIIAAVVPWLDAIPHPFRRVWYMGERVCQCLWAPTP